MAQTPTPVEEWTLGTDLVTRDDHTLQVKVVVPRKISEAYVYVDFEDYDGVVIQRLTPEQARALATMLLYAAEQVDPSGD